MSLQEPDYLDLNKANGKLNKTSDAKSESNIPIVRPIDIVRPASTDGPPSSPNGHETDIKVWIQDHYRLIQIVLHYLPFVALNPETGVISLPQWTISP